MRSRAELATLIGLVGGVASIIITIRLNTGSLKALEALLHAGPIVLIFGGTLGVTFISYPLSDLKHMPRLIGQAFRVPDLHMPDVIDFVARLADKARKGGLLSLQSDIEDVTDPFLKRGMLLLVDGTDPELMYGVMKSELSLNLARRRRLAGMFDAAGGYSPTIGIIGTVLELVHVLGSLDAEPEKLGKAIASAFLATFYGILSANYFWLPIGRKLKIQIMARENHGDMIIEGLMLIQNGQSGRFIRERLQAFLPSGEKLEMPRKETVA